MTPERDWAEKIAYELEELAEGRSLNQNVFAISAALRKVASDKEAEFLQRERKAKAQGMREAAYKVMWLRTSHQAKLTTAKPEPFLDVQLYSLADKIEKGEA